MSTPELTPEQRLQADIDHLRDELANNELASAHATGQQLRYHEQVAEELLQTINSKTRLLNRPTTEALGQKVETSFKWLLTGLAFLLLLASCAKRYGMPAGHNGEYPTPRVALQEGGPTP